MSRLALLPALGLAAALGLSGAGCFADLTPAQELRRENSKLVAENQDLKDRLDHERERAARLREEMADLQKRLKAPASEEDELAAAKRRVGELGAVGLRGGAVALALSTEILFPPGSAEVSPAGEELLGKLAKELNGPYAKHLVILEGHTDSDPIVQSAGRWDSNIHLSAGRSASVMRSLGHQGVDLKRMLAAGRGEFFPRNENRNDEEKRANRRVEIILIPPDSPARDILAVPVERAKEGP